jgi:hypothetical protein
MGVKLLNQHFLGLNDISDMTYKLIFSGIILIFFYGCVEIDNSNLGDGYVYYKDDQIISSVDGIHGEVPSNVLEYAYDKHFIIAKQKPLANDPNILIYDYSYTYKWGDDSCYYWIISKDQKRVFGPLSSIDFVKMKDSLIISKELILKNPNLK